MGMTMSQKILAYHAGLDSVKAGQLINAELDMVLGNDITSPVAVKEFGKAGFSCVKCRDRVSMVMDHFTPNKDIKAAEQVKTVRNFANQYGIENFFDVGGLRAVPYPGFENMLKRLQAAGIKLAVATLKNQSFVQPIFGKYGYDRYFTTLRGSDRDRGILKGRCHSAVPVRLRHHRSVHCADGGRQPLRRGGRRTVRL